MSLHEYADMLFGSARIAAFQAAIGRVVRPGTRVLDVGTGLGTYAFFAAQAGAERVTAIDSDPVIHLARALARDNGLDQRIDFIHARAPEGIPEGQFDLVVFEDFTTRFWDQSSWALLQAIQSRHLAPGGVLLPSGVRFGLAPVTSPGPGVADPSSGHRHNAFGIDWGELRSHLANTGRRVQLSSEAVGALGRTGPRQPIFPLPEKAHVRAHGEWVSTGDLVTALVFWFDLELEEGNWITNRPQARREPWGQWFLPLDPPLKAPAGTKVTGQVWREAMDDGGPGWMGWSCEAGGETRRGHEFAGLPLSRAELSRSAGQNTHTGRPKPKGSP